MALGIAAGPISEQILLAEPISYSASRTAQPWRIAQSKKRLLRSTFFCAAFFRFTVLVRPSPLDETANF
jgi:hypothetical protein